MDINLIGNSLNLCAASRIYFVNPLWNSDLKAQAISTCRRIGQRKEIHIETLILEGSLDEEMDKLKRNTTAEKDISHNEVKEDTSKEMCCGLLRL